MHTQTHINFQLLWHWTLPTSKCILFFLVRFIKHMHCKKSSFLVHITIFSKAKGLSRKQTLNKNSRRAKSKRQYKFNLEPKKKNFWRGLAIEWHKVAKIFPDKATPFFNIQSSFTERFGFSNFCHGKFSYIYLVIFFVFFFTRICSTFFTFIQVQRKKKQKWKNCLKN